MLSNLYLCHIEYSKNCIIATSKELWFAFKLISLSYWIQPKSHFASWLSSCDLLSNLYLCHIEYSSRGFSVHIRPLWFAFKLISLSYWIQQAVEEGVGIGSCDLLSNLYLCHIEYSRLEKKEDLITVVICFQTYIFVILNTALLTFCALVYPLWFAFKLISLSYWIQRSI